MTIQPYLPQDRLRALALNQSLPDRSSGSALFADISGFTQQTEKLTRELGPRRGIEELTRQVNTVYDALIAAIEEQGGSVISFAGDAITCWFDANPAPGTSPSLPQPPSITAVTCAFAMQAAMTRFPDLALKVTMAGGPARRFVVGDPQIQWIDALAGATVTRTSTAEHLARRAEVLCDEATVRELGGAAAIAEWRADAAGERFAVITQLAPGAPAALPRQAPPAVPDELLLPWVQDSVREQVLAESFLTELRPCVVLFVRFVGIDYESDTAGAELDAFIQKLQHTAARYDGTVLQLTIGDKGSYAYVAFGAVSAHEDDARRAVRTALDVRAAAALPVQCGLAQGVMRVGAYGGTTRKTYGVLGDDVNLAARLMTAAAPGEIIVSGALQKTLDKQFSFEPRPPLQLKGKTEPLPIFEVTGQRQRRAIRLQEPNYALPMVGRGAELQTVSDCLERAAAGQAQVIGVIAEAGLGKSRLVAEAIRLAHKKGFVGYGGACQSDGLNIPYLTWKSVWQAFFDVDPEMPLRKQVRWLEGEIEDRAPTRVQALPLLNGLLDLQIPENEFTQNLEPKVRQSALHALLEDCLKSAAQDEPVLIVLEDLHWIDAVSRDLLDQLVEALANERICFVLAYRPPQVTHHAAPGLEGLPSFTRIELRELNLAEAGQAIRAKLAQLYPARGGGLPPGLVDKLMARAQGNPFFLEELLNYLHDRGLDPSVLEKIELPDSLHTLILSRIDQLSEAEKTTLRVASIIGRLFRARWLTGYYPALGQMESVKFNLDKLNALDITPLDTPEPELQYLFKHIVTHEVTYESLPFALRTRLHEQLAVFLEGADAPVDTIVYHYLRSENTHKQREYLRKAGEASQKNFANQAALEYYGQLLPLLEDDRQKMDILLQRGQVWELLGSYAKTEADYRAALQAAGSDPALKARAQFALGKLNRMLGEYEDALGWLAQARDAHARLQDGPALAPVLIEIGTVYWRRGELVQAREPYVEGLAMARAAGDRMNTALALTALGGLDNSQGSLQTARALFEESLALRRGLGDRLGMAASLHGLGLVAEKQGNNAAAQKQYKEVLNLRRELGDKYGMAVSLHSLGNIAQNQGKFAESRLLYEEALALRRAMGDKYGIAASIGGLANLAAKQGDHNAARLLFDEALAIRRAMGDKAGIANALANVANSALAQGDLASAQALTEESLALYREMNNQPDAAVALCTLGGVTLAQGDPAAARAFYAESLAMFQAMDEKSFMGMDYLGLGLADLAENKPGARSLLLRSLGLFVEIGETISQTSSLIGLAGLAWHMGNPRFAAQLLGAVDAALASLQAVAEPDVIHFQAQTLAAVKAALGEAAFTAARDEGSHWSLEEAVQRASQDETG